MILGILTRQQTRAEYFQRVDSMGFGDHQHHNLFRDAAVHNQCLAMNSRGKDGRGAAVRRSSTPACLAEKSYFQDTKNTINHAFCFGLCAHNNNSQYRWLIRRCVRRACLLRRPITHGPASVSLSHSQSTINTIHTVVLLLYSPKGNLDGFLEPEDVTVEADEGRRHVHAAVQQYSADDIAREVCWTARKIIQQEEKEGGNSRCAPVQYNYYSVPCLCTTTAFR